MSLDVFWPGIAGLAGVGIGAWAALRRMRLEKAAEVRQAVFLEAIDSLVSVSRHIGALADLDSNPASSGLSLQTAGLAKLQLVAGGEVIACAAEAMRVYVNGILWLNEQRADALSKFPSASAVEQGRIRIQQAEAANERAFVFSRAMLPLVRALRKELRRELRLRPEQEDPLQHYLKSLIEIEAATFAFVERMRRRLDGL